MLKLSVKVLSKDNPSLVEACLAFARENLFLVKPLLSVCPRFNLPKLHGILMVLACLAWATAFNPKAAWAEAQNNSGVQITQLKTQWNPPNQSPGLYVNAQLRIVLPSKVESALFKSVPMQFVLEATLLKDRWYWTDKVVSTAQRSFRLTYQPLTRRWRLQSYSGAIGASASNTGLGLSRYFDSLTQALQTIAYVHDWQVASVDAIDRNQNHRLVLQFYLDTSPWFSPFDLGPGLEEKRPFSATREVPLLANP
jgi:hypothetical protein